MSDAATLLQQATESTKAGAFDVARAHLQSLLNIEPDHEIGTGMLAAIHAEQGQFAEAAQLFERTLEINPDNPLARMQLGLMQLNLQQPQAALDAFDAGLERNAFGPNACFIHFYRAVALLELEQSDAARDALKRAQEFMPTNHALYPRMLELMIQLDRPSASPVQH